MTTETKASEYADGLRALADMIEANPELVPIFKFSLGEIREPINDREELATFARAAARTGNKVSKNFGSKYASVAVAFGPVTLAAYIEREQVCDRVVVGTEVVVETGPDPEAVAALPVVEREVEREIVEWRCRPLLADEPESIGAAS